MDRYSSSSVLRTFVLRLTVPYCPNYYASFKWSWPIVLFSVWDVAPERNAATQTSSMLTYPQSTCVFLLFVQESTMASTAVRDAKASSRGPSVRILLTHVETTRSAWLTSARGTAANTAATRSASPWAWSGKVCVQDVRRLYWLDFILEMNWWHLF